MTDNLRPLTIKRSKFTVDGEYDWSINEPGNIVIAECFGRVAPGENGIRDARATALVMVESLRLPDLLKRASEELRMIHMKDCAAVYDIGLRTEIRIYLAKVTAP